MLRWNLRIRRAGGAGDGDDREGAEGTDASIEWYSLGVQVILDIPDDVAAQIRSAGQEPSRAVLEALALEGYRTERLTEGEIQRLLGMETRMEVHAFLKEHGEYLHYSLADAEKERDATRRARARRPESPSVRKRRVG